MVKRLILIVALLFAAARANALEYTDVYFNPGEAGWGMFLVQSDTFQFMALFIYGPEGNPTWYTAEMTQDAGNSYTGPLYATTGTYFGSPWQGANGTEVGTASFKPTDIYHATLTYSLNGGPTVTKTVQRQTLTGYKLAGSYSGSMSGTQTGCPDPGLNDDHFRARFNLGVGQSGDTRASLTFNFVDEQNNGLVCNVEAPPTHLGRLYRMVNAPFTCTGPGAPPGSSTVNIESLHPTGQGIEGRLTGNVGGCVMSLSFSAVLNN